MATSSSLHAVLMGDLVGSESYAEPSILHARFNNAISRQNEAFSADIVSPLTITLGDEFQGVLGSLFSAAKVARQIRFELMRHDIDCRLVVGVVEVKTEINRERAWNMMGPGFSTARQKLAEKRSPGRYRFSIKQDPLIETLLEASGATLSAIERDWTHVQRDIIISLLDGATVAELAKTRDVGIHNIYKVRSAGEFDLYTTQWDAICKALSELDHRYGMAGGDTGCTHLPIPA